MNGEIVLYSEVRERVFQMKTAGVFKDQPEKENIKRALESLIDERLIIQVGIEKEMEVSEREIDQAVERVQNSMGVGREELEKLLAGEELTMERYRQTLKDQILASKVVSREVRSQVKLTDDGIKEYYDKNREEFITTPKIRARHIILLLKNDATEEERQDTLKGITRIREEIIAGLDFGEAAIKYSQGPSGPDGGLLGEVSRGDMVKSFESAAFALETGEVSQPVRSKFGYHLIKVESKTAATLISVKEARRDIENKIYQKLVNDVRDEWLTRVKKEAFIDIKIQLN